jgi:O-antigen ligase
MEAVAVTAGVVGLIWGAIVFLRGGLIGGCLAVLLAATCFSYPLLKIELGPLPLTADRVLLALLVVQYVFWRRWGRTERRPLGKADYVLLAFLAMLTASTFSHDYTASNWQPVSWLILFYLMPSALYWIARNAKLTERQSLVILGGFALVGVYLAVTSLAEYYQVSWLVYPQYILTTAQDETAGYIGRARGPLLHPVGNGMLLSICLGSALLWWPRLRRAGQLLLLATAALLLAAILVSLTRSVWIGGVLTLALIVGLALPWSWRLPLLAGGLLAAVALTATQWDNLLAFKRDRGASAEDTANSVEMRPILATVAWQMFLDQPLFGCGYAQYITEHGPYVGDRTADLPLERGRGLRQHNVFLALLTETGLVGLALFVALLLLWARDAWQLWRDPALPLWVRQQGLLLLAALGVYTVNGMFHEVAVVPLANMTLFFLAGVTAGLRAMSYGPRPKMLETRSVSEGC